MNVRKGLSQDCVVCNNFLIFEHKLVNE